MFVHSVYFWLDDDLSPERKTSSVDGIRSLTTIDCVAQGFIGVPAATIAAIIDTSYSYALVLSFADAAAQDAYQIHPGPRRLPRELRRIVEEDRDLRRDERLNFARPHPAIQRVAGRAAYRLQRRARRHSSP